MTTTFTDSVLDDNLAVVFEELVTRPPLADLRGALQFRLDDPVEEEDVGDVVVVPPERRVMRSRTIGDNAATQLGGVSVRVRPRHLHELLVGNLDEYLALAQGLLEISGPLADVLTVIDAFPDIAAAYHARLPEDDGRPGELPRMFVETDLPREVLDAMDGLPDDLTSAPADQGLLLATLLVGLPVEARLVRLGAVWTAFDRDEYPLHRLAAIVAGLADLAARNTIFRGYRAREAHTAEGDEAYVGNTGGSDV